MMNEMKNYFPSNSTMFLSADWICYGGSWTFFNEARDRGKELKDLSSNTAIFHLFGLPSLHHGYSSLCSGFEYRESLESSMFKCPSLPRG